MDDLAEALEGSRGFGRFPFGINSTPREFGDARDLVEDLRRGARNYEPSSLGEMLRNYIDRKSRIERLERFMQRGVVPVAPGLPVPLAGGVRG